LEVSHCLAEAGDNRLQFGDTLLQVHATLLAGRWALSGGWLRDPRELPGQNALSKYTKHSPLDKITHISATTIGPQRSWHPQPGQVHRGVDRQVQPNNVLIVGGPVNGDLSPSSWLHQLDPVSRVTTSTETLKPKNPTSPSPYLWCTHTTESPAKRAPQWKGETCEPPPRTAYL